MRRRGAIKYQPRPQVATRPGEREGKTGRRLVAGVDSRLAQGVGEQMTALDALGLMASAFVFLAILIAVFPEVRGR